MFLRTAIMLPWTNGRWRGKGSSEMPSVLLLCNSASMCQKLQMGSDVPLQTSLLLCIDANRRQETPRSITKDSIVHSKSISQFHVDVCWFLWPLFFHKDNAKVITEVADWVSCVHERNTESGALRQAALWLGDIPSLSMLFTVNTTLRRGPGRE